LNETLVWLAYLIGGGIAFGLVYAQGWRITLATLAGGAIALAIWGLIFATTSSDERSPWLQVELALNGSLSLIFAGAGAAIGAYVRHRRGRK
jgi:hypothetical protein